MKKRILALAAAAMLVMTSASAFAADDFDASKGAGVDTKVAIAFALDIDDIPLMGLEHKTSSLLVHTIILYIRYCTVNSLYTSK